MAYSKNSNQDTSTSERIPNKWELDDKEHARLISDYMRDRIKTSQIWDESITEGWSTDLYRYVYAVADIQAQHIIGKKDIGYNTVDIFGTQVDDNTIKAFLDAQCKLADRGFIEVGIPTNKVSEWKNNLLTTQKH